MKPAAERLRELLSYDARSGEFRWLVATSNRVNVGALAGSISDTTGYRMIRFDRALRGAHRLAFLYMTGSWPAGGVDHIDRDRTNNRWRNLRLATNQQNAFNSGAHRDNQCGFKGVYFHKQSGRWCARIKVGGHRYSVGLFPTAQLAHAAYLAKAQALHGEFFNGGGHGKAQ